MGNVWVSSHFGGFGFGVWQTRMNKYDKWWIVSIGPFTWHKRVLAAEDE